MEGLGQGQSCQRSGSAEQVTADMAGRRDASWDVGLWPDSSADRGQEERQQRAGSLLSGGSRGSQGWQASWNRSAPGNEAATRMQ